MKSLLGRQVGDHLGYVILDPFSTLFCPFFFLTLLIFFFLENKYSIIMIYINRQEQLT